MRKRCSQKFRKFKEKHFFQSLFLIKLQSSRCFPMKFVKYLRTLFLQNTLEGCFLNMFSFELSSVISVVFIADFDHVFVCWGRYRITIPVI